MCTNTLSIIVPVYNSEKYLNCCIDSILNQTYTDFELILVDDGSVDNSAEICDIYADKDKRVSVIHQENSGVSAARNNGIIKATGAWVTFIDSDDWVESDYIQSLMNNVDGDTLIIQGLNKVNNGISDKIALITGEYKNDSLKKTFTNNFNIINYGYAVAKLYKRDVLIHNNIRFDKNLKYAEDLIFMLEYILAVGKVKLIDSFKYNYRYSESSLSNSHSCHENEFKLFKRYELLTNEISEKYVFPINEFTKREGALLLMRSIYAMYQVKDKSRKQRLGIINNILNNYSNYINNYYQPKILMMKICKVLLRTPICFDLFMTYIKKQK